MAFVEKNVGSWPKKRPKKLIYSSINSRATLIDSVAYLLTYGKTFKNTACVCYSSAAINRINTVCVQDKHFSKYYSGAPAAPQ